MKKSHIYLIILLLAVLLPLGAGQTAYAEEADAGTPEPAIQIESVPEAGEIVIAEAEAVTQPQNPAAEGNLETGESPSPMEGDSGAEAETTGEKPAAALEQSVSGQEEPDTITVDPDSVEVPSSPAPEPVASSDNAGSSSSGYSITLYNADGHADIPGGAETPIADILSSMGYEVTETSVISVDPDSVDQEVISVETTEKGLVLKDHGAFTQTSKPLIIYLDGKALEVTVVDPTEISGDMTAAEVQAAFQKDASSQDGNVLLTGDVTVTDTDPITLDAGTHNLFLNSKTLDLSGSLIQISNTAKLRIYGGDVSHAIDPIGTIIGNTALINLIDNGLLELCGGTRVIKKDTVSDTVKNASEAADSSYYYGTIQGAVSANPSTAEVTVLKDTTLPRTLSINENQDITLNLNGHTITADKEASFEPGIFVDMNASLKITDSKSSGGIHLKSTAQSAIIQSTGNVIIEGGTFISESTSEQWGAYIISSFFAGSTTIKGGSFTSVGPNAFCISNHTSTILCGSPQINSPIENCGILDLSGYTGSPFALITYSDKSRLKGSLSHLDPATSEITQGLFSENPGSLVMQGYMVEENTDPDTKQEYPYHVVPIPVVPTPDPEPEAGIVETIELQTLSETMQTAIMSFLKNSSRSLISVLKLSAGPFNVNRFRLAAQLLLGHAPENVHLWFVSTNGSITEVRLTQDDNGDFMPFAAEPGIYLLTEDEKS